MYKLNKFGITRLTDNASIPADPANSDYAEYLEWAAAGNVAEPYVEPPAHVPQSVSMRQAREALIRRGMLATVETHLAGMVGPEGEIARNEWEYSQVVERDRPLTLAMAQVLNLTVPEQLDELFIYASTL